MPCVCRIAAVARVTPAAAGVIAALAGIFWWYARQPLAHTDLWGHLAYGRLIWQTGALPQREPFLPLAIEAPLVDTAWLSQVWLYLVERQAGTAGLQAWHAAMVVLCAALLTETIGRRRPPQRWVIRAGIVMGAFLAVERHQLAIIRPQSAGLACFVGLIAIANSRAGWRRAVWLVSSLFALWANLHGSFAIGLAWLVAGAVGRGIDVARRTRSARNCLTDRRARRCLGLAALGGVATLANPYGLRLWSEVLAFPGRPNLADMIEWQPLDWRTSQAVVFLGAAGVAVMVAACAGKCRRAWEGDRWLAAGINPTACWRNLQRGALATRPGRAAWSEILPLALFGGAAIGSARLLVWWGPLVARFLARRAVQSGGSRSDGSSGALAARRSRGGDGRSWAWTGAALSAVAAAFAFSPVGRQSLGLPIGDEAAQMSPRTPVAAAAWYRAHQPEGLVFSPLEWGDYLVWGGPRELRPFVTSQVQLLPPGVWRDYRAISAGAPESLARLAAYDVGSVVLDPVRQQPLARTLRDAGWRQVHADGLTGIYVRPEKNAAVRPD